MIWPLSFCQFLYNRLAKRTSVYWCYLSIPRFFYFLLKGPQKKSLSQAVSSHLSSTKEKNNEFTVNCETKSIFEGLWLCLSSFFVKCQFIQGQRKKKLTFSRWIHIFIIKDFKLVLTIYILYRPFENLHITLINRFLLLKACFTHCNAIVDLWMQILEDALENLGLILFLQHESRTAEYLIFTTNSRLCKQV